MSQSDDSTPSEVEDAQTSSFVKNCEICGKISHGTHFGAHTCRACAAFFRRTVVKGMKYKCKRADGKCIVDDGAEYICGQCRYNKCKAVGMEETNVQWNRDTTSSTVRSRKRKCQEMVIEKRLHPGWRKHEVLPPAFDMTNIFRKVRRIFTKFEFSYDSSYKEMNSLEKMNWALDRNKVFSKWKNVEISKSFQIRQVIAGSSEMMFGAAEWLMHCEEFRQLTSSEKFKMFMGTWLLWAQFEKIQWGFKLFGERVLKEKILMVSPSEACRMDEFIVDFSAITEKPNEEMSRMFDPLFSQLFDKVIKPLSELQPAPCEMGFLLCQAVFHWAGRQFPGSVANAAEKFTEKVSNDLHEFYAVKNKTGNYAARLFKLINIMNAMENILRERKKIFQLARLFDVFKCRISEPCLFEN